MHDRFGVEALDGVQKHILDAAVVTEPPRLEAALDTLRRSSEDERKKLAGDPSAAGYGRVAAALLLGTEGGAVAKQVLRRAVQGDAALGLTPRERVHVLTRAFDVLGAEAGPLLLPVLGDADGNVRRAAYWSLGGHPDVGLPLARTALADRAQPDAVRSACAWLLSELLPAGQAQPLVAALADPVERISTTALAALADRRWDAGPEFLALLKKSGPHDEGVARFFEYHVIPGATPLLVAALRRSQPGSPVRKRTVKALETQTRLHDIGEDPEAWTRATRSRTER